MIGIASRVMRVVGAGLITLAVVGSGYTAHARVTASVHTITPGTLTFGEDGDMPYTGLDAKGNPTGVDGDILTLIARDLGLKIKVVPTDFGGEIPAILTGRLDTESGGMYYTAARAKVVNITKPAWYDFNAFIERKDTNIDTVQGLRGHPVGTVQGFLYVPDLKKIDFIAPTLHLYQTIDAALQDLAVGRIDMALDGAASGGWHTIKRPEWKLHILDPKPDPIFPETLSKGKVSYAINKNNPSLLAAFNKEIDKLRANGSVKKILAKYGLTNPGYFNP